MKNLLNKAGTLIARNWKTSALGVASLIIGGLVQTGKMAPESGVTLTAAIAGVLGLAAKDSNVSGNASSN